jgi:hypothetical protein
MKEGDADIADLWPESSQTFGYLRAKKRHALHLVSISRNSIS